MFRIRKPGTPEKSATKEDDAIRENHKQAFETGLSVAKLLTSYWNSQRNPGKAYIFNRRIHHGEIGSLLGLSNLFKKSQPLPTGVLSGLGEGLAKDDYHDRKEWFTFKKKEKNPEPLNPTSEQTQRKVGDTEEET